jgi:hypothetical protein
VSGLRRTACMGDLVARLSRQEPRTGSVSADGTRGDALLIKRNGILGSVTLRLS